MGIEFGSKGKEADEYYAGKEKKILLEIYVKSEASYIGDIATLRNELYKVLDYYKDRGLVINYKLVD